LCAEPNTELTTGIQLGRFFVPHTQTTAIPMTRVPFTTLRATANPRINTDPRRYTTADQIGNDPPLPQEMNLAVDQTLNFLNFVTVDDAKLEVFNHATPTATVPMRGTDFCGVTVTPITEETPYVFSVGPDHLRAGGTRRAVRRPAVLGPGTVVGRRPDSLPDRSKDSCDSLAVRPAAHPRQHRDCAAVRRPRATLGVQTVGGLTAPLDDFDHALALIKTNDRPMDDLVIMMNSRAYRKVLSLQRAAGGDEAISFRYCEELGFNCLHYAGVPVCINEHIPTTTEGRPTSTSSTATSWSAL
jgi:hypothetical protein